MSALGDRLYALEEIVGAESLLTDTEAVASYRVDGEQPLAVALPESSEQVAALLREAAEGGLSVLMRGAGRHMHLGAPPTPIGLVVSMDRLRRVVEYDAENLTITAQAGMPLGTLQGVVGERAQMLPLDPRGGDGATLGGVVAANLAGPIRMRYGSPRDLVIGLRVALADGALIKAGGKTVKNVAGYDLSKLFVGSFGTLGAICEVTVRLTPKPESRAMLVLAMNSAEVKEVTGKLLRSRLEIASLDIANEAAVRRMRLSLPITLAPELRIVFVGLMGDRAAMVRQENEIRASSGGAFARLDGTQGGHAWLSLREAPHPNSVDEIVARAALPISYATETVDLVSQFDGWWSVARAGDGVVYAGPPREATTEMMVDRLAELREFAQRREGVVILEAASLEMKRGFSVWGDIPNLDLLRKLKDAYDPTGNLGCWRYLPRR